MGNRTTGAKVNGKIVQLDYQLKNGDIVDILTSKETYGPKRDWLKLAKTGEARNKIKQWFKKECREENIMRGREELERELKANELYDIFHQEEVQNVVLRKYSFKTLDEMYAADVLYEIFEGKQVGTVFLP